MIRPDLRTDAAARAHVTSLIIAALPNDGSAVCYAPLGKAGGEEAGPLVQDLINSGIIRCTAANDVTLYARAA